MEELNLLRLIVCILVGVVSFIVCYYVLHYDAIIAYLVEIISIAIYCNVVKER